MSWQAMLSSVPVPCPTVWAAKARGGLGVKSAGGALVGRPAGRGLASPLPWCAALYSCWSGSRVLQVLWPCTLAGPTSRLHSRSRARPALSLAPHAVAACGLRDWCSMWSEKGVQHMVRRWTGRRGACVASWCVRATPGHQGRLSGFGFRVSGLWFRAALGFRV